jgi:general secretion pathway protein D
MISQRPLIAVIALTALLGISPVPALPQTVVLEAVQSQQLANGHARVLLQFNGPVSLRPTSPSPTTNFVLQIAGATAAPNVPTLQSVNIGNVQSVALQQFGTTLTITFALSSPVQPNIASSPSGVYVVDVPPGQSQSQPQRSPFGQPAYPTPTPTPASNGQLTKMIRLRYADVSEVVGILTNSGGQIAPSSVFNPQPSNVGIQQNGFGEGGFQGGFQGGVQGGFQGGFGQPSVGGYSQSPFGNNGYSSDQSGVQTGQRISDNLAIDRRLNAVILSGTADQIAQAETLIRIIDVPVDSVLLDTEVLEVTDSGAKALGLDYSQTTTDPLTHIYNQQSQILNNINAGAVPGSIPLQSNIFLLVSRGLAKVLASPKILTEDNQAAYILTGDSLPIRVTTPTSVGGVGAVSSQVEYINVGVNLEILPHVTGDGGVDTGVYSQVSSVTGFDSANDPQISTRQAQTKVILREGQSLVIGGLIQNRDIRNLQKIPILGDLPLVGALFRFYTETRENTNLIITVTPHIIAAPVTSGVAPIISPVP